MSQITGAVDVVLDAMDADYTARTQHARDTLDLATAANHATHFRPELPLPRPPILPRPVATLRCREGDLLEPHEAESTF